jgi:hypothetical protein
LNLRALSEQTGVSGRAAPAASAENDPKQSFAHLRCGHNLLSTTLVCRRSFDAVERQDYETA